MRCPHGHESAADDYCDDCGSPMDGGVGCDVPPPCGPSLRTEMLGAPPAPAGSDPCPVCGAPHSASDRFCEGCGGDVSLLRRAAHRSMLRWVAVVTPDRSYFDRVGAAELRFPEKASSQVIPLNAETIVIGRVAKSSRGDPDPECSIVVADPGVSSRHAVLTRADSGGYRIEDVGSTNGTTLNSGPDPIPSGYPVLLTDGDVVQLGAWTTITVRREG